MSTTASTPHELFQRIGTGLECKDQSCVCHQFVFQRSFTMHCPLSGNHTPGAADPGLEITLNDVSGTITVRCHAGCTEEALIAALRSRNV